MAALTRRATALEIIQDAMGELGLSEPGYVFANATTATAANPEKTAKQFAKLLNKAGRKIMMGEYKWQVLTAEHTITTVSGQATYALPSDFNGYVSDAGWNRTTRLPAIGALEQFEWQAVKARLLGGNTFVMMYVLNEGGITFQVTPTSVQTIVIAYTSSAWVRSADVTPVPQDKCISDTDVVLLDPELMRCALKLAFYEAKQFDTSKFMAEYKEILASAKANDAPGRTMSLAGKHSYPYLGMINVPSTGLGT